MATASKSVSSYLPADTYNSLPKDGDLTFLHTMLRVNDLDATMAFFSALGLMETRRKESEKGKFTLVFMASAPGTCPREERPRSGHYCIQRRSAFWHPAFATPADPAAHPTPPTPPHSIPGAPEIELTYNWGGEEFAPPSRSMGHLAFATDDIYGLCEKLRAAGHVIHRPPRDGKMAFVKSPDGISVELLQKGTPLEPEEPWASAENVGEW
jgi:lactoylglutathione lyase